MKICLINNLYKPYTRGGAEVVFENIVEEIKKNNHEVIVITSKSITKSIKDFKYSHKIYHLRSLNIISYNNLSIIPKPLRIFWHIIDMFDISNYFKVKSILQKEKCDLVITHNLKGIGYLIPKAIKKTKTKHIHSLHDIQLLHPSGLMFCGKEKILDNFLTKIHYYINAKLFNSPNIVTSPSKWLLNLHTEKGFFKNSKKLIIPGPIKNTDINLIEKQNLNLFSFIYVGQIEDSKGIGILIKAFLSLCDKRSKSKCELNIVGDGSMLEKYKKYYKNYNNINFLGRINNKNVYKHINNSKALIVPSICYENSPTVIYEAHTTNTPVIASRIGGITELIHDLGGLLFKPNNEGDLMYQMKWLIDNYDEVIKKSEYNKQKIKKYNINNYINNLLKNI